MWGIKASPYSTTKICFHCCLKCVFSKGLHPCNDLYRRNSGFTLLPFKWPVNGGYKTGLCTVVNCCTVEPWNIKLSKHLPGERQGDLRVNLLLQAKMQASAFENLKRLTSLHTNCMKWIFGSGCSAFHSLTSKAFSCWIRVGKTVHTDIKTLCKCEQKITRDTLSEPPFFFFFLPKNMYLPMYTETNLFYIFRFMMLS